MLKRRRLLLLITVLFFMFSRCFFDSEVYQNKPTLKSKSIQFSIQSNNSSESLLTRATKNGPVKGFYWNDEAFAWLGIPYAKPPVGELRWRAPLDPDPWDGERESNEFCSECPQLGGIMLNLDSETYGEPIGSEDCLYLNVWRPSTKEEDLPVFVWIHGGMNTLGSSDMTLYHGANLAIKGNMIVVSMNFRLGLLGWFTHKFLDEGNSLDNSGNYGLLDIIKSLEWIKQNINNFGGNPDNITIAGESAGGFNVISLLASPLAKGLFHRAIAQSSAASLTSSMKLKGQLVAHNLLVKMLIKDGLAKNKVAADFLILFKGKKWVRNYLRSKEVYEIILNTNKISSIGINEVGIAFENALQGSRFIDGTVIPDQLDKLFKNGNYNKVPLMLGSNTEEFKIFEIGLGFLTPYDAKGVCDLIVNFNPENSGLELDKIISPEKQPLYNYIGRALGDKVFQEGGVDSIATILSDYHNVYAYKFGWNDLPEPMDFLIGASHMIEIPFFFGNFQQDKSSLFRFAWNSKNSYDVGVLSDKIINYLSQFVRGGNPNDGKLPLWEKWDNSKSLKRLYLDNDIHMIE